jgi:hypothetical protein
MKCLPIILSWSPQQDVTCLHLYHVAQNFINIFSNRKWNYNLFSHFHFTTIIQPLQSIWFNMLNSTQIQFTNKGGTTNINTVFIIYNYTIYLALYITICMEDVLPLFISFIFLDLDLWLAIGKLRQHFVSLIHCFQTFFKSTKFG